MSSTTEEEPKTVASSNGRSTNTSKGHSAERTSKAINQALGSVFERGLVPSIPYNPLRLSRLGD